MTCAAQACNLAFLFPLHYIINDMLANMWERRGERETSYSKHLKICKFINMLQKKDGKANYLLYRIGIVGLKQKFHL